MTTEDFNVLLRSMEGQFQINLARPWAHESDQGGVQRMIAEDAITVHNKDLRLVAEGTVNSNSNNETLATICSYVQCPGTTQQQCIDSFIPFGHCCPVCGTRIEIVAMHLNFEKAKAVVFTVLSEMESDAHIFATFERKTVDWGTSMYEIAIISSENITLDEDFHKRATDMILERLTVTMKTNQEQAILKVNILSSKIDRTVRTESKVIACLIYGCIIIGLVGMFAYQNIDLTVSRHNLFSPVIKYRRQNDDVAIEMDGVGEEEIPEEDEVETEEVVPEEPTGKSVEEDDVEDWRNINPNFTLASSDDNQTSFELMETFKKEDEDEENGDITEFVTEDVDVSENPEVISMKNEMEEEIEEQKEEAPVDEKIEPESLIPEDIAVENEDLMPSEEIHSSSENLIIKEDNEAEEVANILDINPNFVEEEASEPVENREESENETEEESEDVTNSEEMDLVQL
uniref:Protein amnionless n=2 Tax=Caenorhabditis tropicalis TaxID=1561998 RepID=A0A1I7T4Y2_9PELO